MCRVQWFSEEDKERNIPEGLYLLKRFPDLEIKPEAFIPDSRAKLENTVRKIIGHFSPMEVEECDASVIRPSDRIDEKKFGDEVIAKWIDFAENRVPLNDDTKEYSRHNQLHIPLFDKLFAPSSSVIVRHSFKTPVQALVKAPTVKATASVAWAKLRHKAIKPRLDHDKNSEDSDKDDETEEMYYYELTNAQRRTYKKYIEKIGSIFEDIRGLFFFGLLLFAKIKIKCLGKKSF